MQFLQLELLKAQERRRSAVVPPPGLNTTTGGRSQGETLVDQNATAGGRGQAATRSSLNTTTGGRGQGAVLTRAGGRGQEVVRTDLSTGGNSRQKGVPVVKDRVSEAPVNPSTAAQKPIKQEVKTGEYQLTEYGTSTRELSKPAKEVKFVCYKSVFMIRIRMNPHCFGLA
jgi:hypothetical protein